MDIIGTLPGGIPAFVGAPTAVNTPPAPASTNPQANVAGMTPQNTQLTPPTSTTTISNNNKMAAVPGIVNTTNQLAQTGITTNAAGSPQYANGTLVPDTTTSSSGAPDLSKNTGLSQGGYIGDTYYTPGSQLPVGTDGKPMQTTETSPSEDQILKSLNDMKAQSDAMTASIIDSIHSQYAQLIQQQKQVNAGQEALVNTALLMGGVTGQGSSAQFAPISSAGIIHAQISYGLSQIGDLQNKESMAIIAAQQAGQSQDFQLMDKINGEISKIRDEKVAAATKLNDTIAAQNKKIADEKQQALKDTAVTNLFNSGVTDPGEILKKLNDSGLTINASEVKAVVDTYQAKQDAVAKEIQAAGIATPFANHLGELQNSKTGYAYTSSEDFQAKTGITVQQAQSQGLVTSYTSSAVSDSINQLVQEAAKNGADKNTLTAIRNSKTVPDAILAAGTYIKPPQTPADYNASFAGQGYSQPPPGGFRTDRNNNAVAMTTDVAKSLGLVEGQDYIQGDSFKDKNGNTLYTAHLLGDSIETTIKGLDTAANDPSKQAFFTQRGQARWSYINMTDDQWKAMTPEQKKATVIGMYKHEGGSGQLAGASTATQGSVTTYQTDPTTNKIFKVTTKDGKQISKVEQKTTDTVPKDSIDTVGSNLQANTGRGKGDPKGDNYVSPEDYNTGLQQWVDKGYSAKTYYDNFHKFVNPDHSSEYNYYPQ